MEEEEEDGEEKVKNVTESFKKPFCSCLVEDVNLGIAFLDLLCFYFSL